MTASTLRLAPASLRGVLAAYRGYVDRGLLDAVEKERNQPSGVLTAVLQTEIQQIPDLAKRQTPFEEVAYRFGRVAGLAYLLNDPLRDPRDPKLAAICDDYRGYLERKLPLMPLTFDGYDDPPMEGDADAYFRAGLARQARYREALLFCYYKDGRQLSSDTFDDRSNAYGVAQSIASHAVSDAAKTWFYLWGAMDGDLSATPYYHPPKDAKEAENK